LRRKSKKRRKKKEEREKKFNAMVFSSPDGSGTEVERTAGIRFKKCPNDWLQKKIPTLL